MDKDLRDQLDMLERAVLELEKASKRALGFVSTIEYMGIAFNVSRRFVIADVSPLAFFHLVEHIDESAEIAIARLYERVGPLLLCEHSWTPLKRTADEHIRHLGRDGLYGESGVHICTRCTAYALGGPLPAVGRTLP